MAVPEATAAEQLVSFVPRLTIEWLRSSPDLSWLEVDGTLAFIDISGFTAMSEQLSGRGKAGAEEVTDVMNATFSALLDVAYAEGGGLLKFGGDALLLLYDGDDHAARAARAAFGMRSRLRAIGRPRTSIGAVQLKMHAGIHSGRFQFFLVGETHRELLVSGPAATRTVEMEAASEAGEILVSAETAAELDDGAVGEPKGPGHLLKAAPDASTAVAPLPAVPNIPLEQAVPAPLRAQLLEVGPLEGEHRQAAIAFVRFGGIDEIVTTEGAASAAEALGALVEQLQAAAADHEVTFLESDVDRDGGRIILVSGAPQTFGDNEARLLRTVRAAVDAGLPLPVHVGVSQGRVFAGQVGAPFRRTYTVLGDTAALAARLMARAGEDEIWVARDAYERGGERFASTELEPLTLKGKAEPVHAVMLGELLAEHEAAADEPLARERLPFFDRERERAVLGAAVAPVRMGFGTLVELIGEPGIGKSRLAEELEGNCADMEKIGTRCDQYESTTPYYPFRPLLRSLLDVELNGGSAHNRAVLAERVAQVDADLVPWVPLLGAPLDVEVESTPEVDDLDPAFWRARLHGVMGRLLDGLLVSPTLLMFEDVHWMDDASSELLRFLGTQLPTRPWLTCTTRRPVEGGFAAAQGTPPLPALTLRLEPLPEEDAKALVRAAAGNRSLSDEELAAVMDRGAGNPLFLTELASTDDAVQKAEELPDTVQALVATRIDRLGPGDRALLRWAAVLGVAFSGALIAEVLEDDPNVVPASEAWERLGEFVEMDPNVPGGFRFRHALIRDAAYEGLSYRRRHELHGRVGDVIERRQGAEAAELLSLHFSRAERWSEAWRYSMEAGRQAKEKYANVEAAEFYRRAIDAAKGLPGLDGARVAEAWEALSDCLRVSGQPEDAAAALAEARALLPMESRVQVELMHKEGKLREDMGAYSEAIEWYSRGLTLAETLRSDIAYAHLVVKLHLGQAEALFFQGSYDECIPRFNEVVRQATSIQDLEQLANAYMMLHLAHTMTGSTERVAFRGLALPIYEELGDLKRQATVLNNLGIDAYYDGDWDKSLDTYQRSLDLFERLGDVTRAAMARCNIGEILSDQGRLDEAEELFLAVQSVVDAAGHKLLSATTRLNRGRVSARAGRFDDATALLTEAHDGFVAIEAENTALEAEVRQAETAALEGRDPDGALALAEGVLTRTGSAAGMAVQKTVALRVKGAALLQLGRRSDAELALRESVHLARDGNLAYELALALDLLAFGLADPEAEAESSRLLEALHVERVARPPL